MNGCWLLILSLMVTTAIPRAHAEALKFVFDQPIQLAQPSSEGLGPSENIAAGTPVMLSNDKVYWVQAIGKVPILVLPAIPSRGDTALRVQMPEVAAWPPAQVEHEIDSKLSRLIVEMSVFQDAIRKKKTDEAEKALQRMEQVGHLEYLNFMRAALKFTQGDIESAKESVKRGLQRYPANEEGQQFLKRLETYGGKQ